MNSLGNCGAATLWNTICLKKKAMNCAGKWMGLEEVTLSEVTRIWKGKCCVFALTGGPPSKSSRVSTQPGVTAETRNVKQNHCQDREVGEQ